MDAESHRIQAEFVGALTKELTMEGDEVLGSDHTATLLIPPLLEKHDLWAMAVLRNSRGNNLNSLVHLHVSMVANQYLSNNLWEMKNTNVIFFFSV